jgi:hypothetical protein
LRVQADFYLPTYDDRYGDFQHQVDVARLTALARFIIDQLALTPSTPVVESVPFEIRRARLIGASALAH